MCYSTNECKEQTEYTFFSLQNQKQIEKNKTKQNSEQTSNKSKIDNK